MSWFRVSLAVVLNIWYNPIAFLKYRFVTGKPCMCQKFCIWCKKKKKIILLMNPKIISAKSTSVWHEIWIIDVNILVWYLTQLWLMNFKNWLRYLLEYTGHMLLIPMLNLTVVLSHIFANGTANSSFLERFNSNFSRERKLSST